MRVVGGAVSDLRIQRTIADRRRHHLPVREMPADQHSRLAALADRIQPLRTDNLNAAAGNVGLHLAQMGHFASRTAQRLPRSLGGGLDLLLRPLGEAHAQIAHHRAVLRGQRPQRLQDRRRRIRRPRQRQRLHRIPVDQVPRQSLDAPANTRGQRRALGVVEILRADKSARLGASVLAHASTPSSTRASAASSSNFARTDARITLSRMSLGKRT